VLVLGSAVLGLALLAGCASGPVPGNPLLVNPGLNVAAVENPLFVPQGPAGYNIVFDRTYDVLSEYFQVKRSNRFDGLIETWPLMTAGYLDFPRLGLYDSNELLEATFQTQRRYAVARITPADSGGYLIDLHVYKELEDLAKPAHGGGGAATIRLEAPIERMYEVVDPLILSKGWIPIGRDCALERVVLEKLRGCL
jgi:hypothetical protein